MAREKTRFLTIKEAAIFLGISPQTLRLWDKSGMLKPADKGKKNGYRFYCISDLQRFKQSQKNKKKLKKKEKRGKWGGKGAPHKVERFYG